MLLAESTRLLSLVGRVKRAAGRGEPRTRRGSHADGTVCFQVTQQRVDKAVD